MMGFYEEIAADYDHLTRFQERLARETKIMIRWIARYHFRSAVDVACGSGLHAIILAQLGVRAVGADLSETMIEQAKRHAAEFQVAVDWVVAAMEDAPPHIKGTFDAVLCLGNSLPHLLTQGEFETAIRNFAKLLCAGGVVILQLLNYQRIISREERIIGIHRHGDTEYIRFYDFLPYLIQFNLLTIKWKPQAATHTLHSTCLYPYQADDLTSVLLRHGFREIELFGDMNFQPFDADASPNLVIVAKK